MEKRSKVDKDLVASFASEVELVVQIAVSGELQGSVVVVIWDAWMVVEMVHTCCRDDDGR